MRFLNLSIPFTLLFLASHTSALGEHTINRQGITDFSIERSIPERFNDEDATIAACIALPDGWSAPSIVSSSGNATTAFTREATRYLEGETQIATLQALEGYHWYCYQDTQRSFASEESAKVSFSLSSSDTDTTIYSSIGFIEGVSVGPRSAGSFYYQSISSHQILRDTQAANYYQNLSTSLTQSEFISDDFDPSSASYEIVKVDNTVYFLGYSGTSFSIDENHVLKSYETPNNSRSFYINNQFIFLISEGNPQVLDTKIQFGSDLNNLSEIYDIKEVGYASDFAYDTNNNQYVLLNPGTSSNSTKAYYTSSDLKTWSENTVGQWQNYKVTFANDGRAVMRNTSLVDSLMSRTASGEWIPFEHYPTDQYFSARDILFAHDRFYTLLTEYSISTPRTVLGLYIGYSNNLENWNWKTLSSSAENIASVPTLVELGANQIAVINNETFYVSSDKGVNWSDAMSPLSALNLDSSVSDETLKVSIHSLSSINGSLIGSAKIYQSNNKFSDFIFSGENESQFKLIHRAENPKLFSFENALYFYESSKKSWAIYKETDASLETETETETETEESSSNNSSGGSLFWLLCILAAFGSIRQCKTKIYD